VARRRGDTPLTIVALGIVTVVLFGGSVIYYSTKTPILQLAPELEKRYMVDGFVTRFIPGRPPAIDITAPAGLVKDEAGLTDLAVFSLEAYRKIAGSSTQVDSCVAKVKDAPGQQVRVTVELAARYTRAQTGVNEVKQCAHRVGLTGSSVQVLGVAQTGASVRVTASTQRADALALADRTVAAVSSLAFIGRVEVGVAGPGGPIERRGGRDTR
jgi:hypothetical protein